VGKREPHFWTMGELARWTRRAAIAARELVRNREYDLCHCWSGWPSGLIGYQLRRQLPYLVALRGSDVPGYNNRLRWLDPLLFRPLSRAVWKRAAAVTCVSRSLEALARQTAADLRYEVIPNGSSTTDFQPSEVPPTFDVLFVGRLIERKGVIHLLRAFAELCKTRPDCRLRVVGGGPERLALERFCRHSGIDGRVRFFGAVSHGALPEIYAGARVFVMPALEEALPNAVLEAMASGLPIITTDTGAAEVLDGNGMVVPRGDEVAMWDALQRYLRDPELCARHGKRSRELAETMTWGAKVDAYLDLYRRICAQSRADS
jgi:glycosyltransferase involved in cell wall biosynthesis